MGYYSSLEEDLKIQKEKIKELKDTISTIYSEWETSTTYKPNKEWIGYWLSDFNIDENGYVSRTEYYDKFYDDLEYIKFIREYLDEGEHSLILTGEDGEKVGYRIYVKGGVPSVYEVYFKEVLGQEIDFK